MKNICIFERSFKIQKNSIFLFGIYIFFCFRDIDIFVLYKLGNMTSLLRCATKRVKHQIKNISGNIEAVFFQLGTKKCMSQKKPNNTNSVVAIETLLAPVSFCQKPNIPILNPLKLRTEGWAWNGHGYHIVLITLIIRLDKVNGPWLRWKLGISV